MKKIIVYTFVGFVLVLALSFTGYRLSNSRTFQFFGGIIHRIDTNEKVVALTFDDGPTEKTDEVLLILEELDVKATFYVTGRELEVNMGEGRKIVQAGHELGNHTYSHNRMVFKAPSFIKEELSRTDDLIREAGYKGEITFRPPNGKKLILLPYYLRQQNKKTIMWDLEPDSYPDIAFGSETIVQNVIENVKPGSIILLHVMYDSRQESVNAIEGIVRALREKGYTFKTVGELLEYR